MSNYTTLDKNFVWGQWRAGFLTAAGGVAPPGSP